jgi:TonB family protein
MTESHPVSIAETKPHPEKPSTIRLVIRAEIIPDEPTRTHAARPANRRALAVIVGVAAVLVLVWVGVSVFRSEPTPSPAVSEGAQNAGPPVPKPTLAAPTATTGQGEIAPVAPPSAETRTVESEVRDESDTSLSPINEVVPTPSQGALQTIRGTIRVSVQVTIDKQGTVIAATPEDPGPSRYFERLSIEAAKKWTFPPVNHEDQRQRLLRFHFTREGATARVAS